MPLIGFTVFHDEVRDGKKRQTIRRQRALARDECIIQNCPLPIKPNRYY